MIEYFNNISNKIYLPLLYITVGVLFYFMLEKMISKIFNVELDYVDIKKRRKKTLESIFKNIMSYVITFSVIISILNVFNVNTRTLVAGFGILGIIIGFSLQDILKDFLSGIFIVFDNKYDVGDVVSINNYKGEVIFLGLKSTRIKSIDGDIKIILNRNITEVINYSLGNSRVVIDISISNDFDVEQIEKELELIFNKMDGKIKHAVGKIILLGVNKVDGLSTTYRMVVQADPLKHTVVQREILKRLKKELDGRKIKIISLVGGQLWIRNTI